MNCGIYIKYHSQQIGTTDIHSMHETQNKCAELKRSPDPNKIKKNTHCMVSQNSRKVRPTYSDSISRVAWGWGWAGGKRWAKGKEEVSGNNGCLYYLDCGDGFSDIFIVQIYQIVYVKRV